jgi:hypothetical protein
MVELSPSLTPKNMAYLSPCDVPCFQLHGKVHKHLVTCHAPTLHWGIAKPCHCKWGWRKDQGQRLSVSVGCSIASTIRKKKNSFPYCQTSYDGDCYTSSQYLEISAQAQNIMEIAALT